MGTAWRPIEDLPENWPDLRQRDLENLASIWREQASKLKDEGALREFNERLSREWSIETGIIENLYTLDRGTTILLIERGLEASLISHGASDKPAEEVVAILRDHQDVLDGLFDFVASRRKLSTSYIKELHQALTRHQASVQALNHNLGKMIDIELLRGDWKRLPNNPTRPDGSVHQYCPPEQVVPEMERLVEMHHRHQAEGIPCEIEAAWLHHRFTQIHPFQDGNGRMARALASLVFIHSGWFPLIIHRDIRSEYIDALETADGGDLSALVKLFADRQKKSLIRALSISEKVLGKHRSEQQVISAITDTMQRRRRGRYQQYQQVFNLADEMKEFACSRLRQTSRTIGRELQKLDKRFSSQVDMSNGKNDFWFRRQIVATAKVLDYYADTRTYRAWSRLIINEDRQVQLVISFHSLGYDFVGVIGVSAFLLFRDKKEKHASGYEGPHVVCRDVFQFSFGEGAKDIKERLGPWLDEVILTALDHWRRQL